MKKMYFLCVYGAAIALLCGCQSTLNLAPPTADEELRSELDEQEKEQIYNEYMMRQSMMRQRQEVAREQQRQRQLERENAKR